MGEWHASWSPKRSPKAASIGSAPPATRSTCSSTCRSCSTTCRRRHALIIRSATQVTAEVLEAGSDLVVVGRAGHRPRQRRRPEAATKPRRDGGERAAEQHHLGGRAHDGAAAAAGPQRAPGARRAQGRSLGAQPWEGVELADKTLGVVGLGRIGKLVADRAKAFGMRSSRTTRSCRPTVPARWASS
jgi:phosphoglycerate dehydrogenase-like enzyme